MPHFTFCKKTWQYIKDSQSIMKIIAAGNCMLGFGDGDAGAVSGMFSGGRFLAGGDFWTDSSTWSAF